MSFKRNDVWWLKVMVGWWWICCKIGCFVEKVNGYGCKGSNNEIIVVEVCVEWMIEWECCVIII